jgi:hypothetical protein
MNYSLPLLLLSGVEVWTTTPISVDYVITAGSATLGPSAPSFEENDHCAGLAFDADAEEVFLVLEIPDCWSGSAVSLRIYWCPQSGDAPQLNETVKFDVTWRSINWSTDDTDHLTQDTGTITYTETSDPGDDKDTFISTINLTESNQTITAGDTIVIHFDRDVGADTYSGLVIIALWEINIPQNQFPCDHHN